MIRLPIHKIFLGTVLLCGGLVLTGGKAMADCSGPEGTEGTIIYNSQHKVAQFCNGTDWIGMAGGRSSSPGDTVMSNWPDAIACSDGSGFTGIFYAIAKSSTATSYRYIASPTAPGSIEINFDAAGNYDSQANSTSFDCVTNSWSIADLYAQGRAFNFVGGQGDGDSSNDNLGNGTGLSGNIQLGAYYLSGDGDNEGILIDSDGRVAIGTSVFDGSGLHIDHSGGVTVSTGNFRTKGGSMYVNASPNNQGFALLNSDSSNLRWIMRLSGTGAGENNGDDFIINARNDDGSPNFNALLIDRATGNVGIGATDPGADFGDGINPKYLHVSNTSGQSVLALTNDNTTTGAPLGSVSFGTTGGTATDKRAAIITSNLVADSSTAVSGSLSFYTKNAGTDVLNMYMSPDGRIGIGTDNPQQNLHVYNADTRAIIQLESPNSSVTDQQYIALLTGSGDGETALGTDGAKGWAILARGENYGGSGHIENNDMGITYYDGTDWNTYFKIDSVTGNIGIGTDEPETDFVISKDGSPKISLNSFGDNTLAPGLFFVRGDGTAASPAAVDEGSTIGHVVWQGYGTSTFFSGSAAKIVSNAAEDWTDSTGAATLEFHTRPPNDTGGSDLRMMIDENGNVGIGTADPQSKLDVQGGDISVVGSINVDKQSGDGLGIKLAERSTLYGPKIAWLDDASQPAAVITKLPTDGLGFYTGGAHTGGNEKMVIDESGDVGIGVLDPQYKLDVGGAMRINSPITSWTSNGAVLYMGQESTSSGAPASDGATMQYVANLFGASMDGLLIEKTDFNAVDPDGGIMFAKRGNNGTRVPNLVIRGTGNIGIGTDQPQAKLVLGNSTSGGGPAGSYGNYQIILYTSGSANSSYGMGIESSHMWFNSGSAYKFYAGGSHVSTIGSNGAYAQVSDLRLKKNVTSVENALDKIMKLDGVNFTWKDELQGGNDIGLIAQNVQKTFPEVVNTDQNGMLSVSYANLVAPVIEALKELKGILDGYGENISQLFNDTSGLKAENEALRSEIEAMKADIEALKASQAAQDE